MDEREAVVAADIDDGMRSLQQLAYAPASTICCRKEILRLIDGEVKTNAEGKKEESKGLRQHLQLTMVSRYYVIFKGCHSRPGSIRSLASLRWTKQRHLQGHKHRMAGLGRVEWGILIDCYSPCEERTIVIENGEIVIDCYSPL